MTWYDAQFTDGERRFTVGPFDTPHEAEQFGRAHHGQHLDYTGWAERKGRQELERMVGTLQLNDASRIAEGRRYGVVTRWQPGATQGFITDAEGTSWFVSQDDLPGHRTELTQYTKVTFTGSPKPHPR